MQLIKNCARSILSELRLKNFGFDYDYPEEFYRSQWQRGQRSLFYLVYRWLWAFGFGGILIASFVLQFSDGKLFIFLTNWGIMLCLATNLIGALLVTRWHFKDESDESDGSSKASDGMTTETTTSGWVKLYWLLHGVTLLLALVITTVYWTFLHGKMNKPVRYPVMSFITHCMNSVLMLIDFLIVAFPVRFLHTVYSMMLPIAYCLFTVIYFFCGGVDEYGNHYVYPILDWRTPVRGLTTFAGVFGLYLIYGLVIFSLFKLKRLLHRTVRIVWSPQVAGLI